MIFDSNRHKAFFDDIRENGFHIFFSCRNAKIPGFRPNSLPLSRGTTIELKLDDVSTRRITYKSAHGVCLTSAPRCFFKRRMVARQPSVSESWPAG